MHEIVHAYDFHTIAQKSQGHMKPAAPVTTIGPVRASSSKARSYRDRADLTFPAAEGTDSSRGSSSDFWFFEFGPTMSNCPRSEVSIAEVVCWCAEAGYDLRNRVGTAA